RSRRPVGSGSKDGDYHQQRRAEDGGPLGVGLQHAVHSPYRGSIATRDSAPPPPILQASAGTAGSRCAARQHVDLAAPGVLYWTRPRPARPGARPTDQERGLCPRSHWTAAPRAPPRGAPRRVPPSARRSAVGTARPRGESSSSSTPTALSTRPTTPCPA